MTTSALLDELGWRGLIHLSSEGLEQRLGSGPVSAYIGFDASATSLHVGHLLQVFLLTHLQRAGGRPVILIGGGTGMIGDPSGKSGQRKLLDADAIERNSAALHGQLERFLDFSPGPTQPLMLNNLEWLGSLSVIDFLRDIGKHFTVPYMLAKDSVQARLAAGMSFTEFSYQTLQAADFLHLHRTAGVDMQMGGADQWGNITAGLELIRRVENREAESEAVEGESAESEGEQGGEGHQPTAFGLCSPLLLNRSGQKMGKSEKGAVFLDASLTSPFDFYQYWINDDDELVVDHLRWLTTKEREEIEAIAHHHADAPERRMAQAALAFDLTERVHGHEEAERQVTMAGAAFARSVDDPAVLEALYHAIGGFEFGAEAGAWTALDVAVAASGQSRGDARRLITQGGLSINGEKLTDPSAPPPPLVADRYWWVAMGKKRRGVGRRTG
jgi:tyrosyl-tRNA synthetase